MIKQILTSVRGLKNYASEREIAVRLDEIEAAESLDAAEKRAKQSARLALIIEHAKQTVPYFRQCIAGKGDLQEQFGSLPLLTKSLIRQHGDRLRAQPHPPRVIEETSGGTTGEPVKIWQDGNYLAWMAAHKEHYFTCVSGLPHGERRFLQLWGSESELLNRTRDLRARFRSYLDNAKFLNSFSMSDPQIASYIDVINRFKPDVIEAYVQSLHLLARYAVQHGRKVHNPRGIIVSAGCYDDAMDDEFRTVFPSTRIANRYGSREVGDIACSCDGPEHLHLSMLTHYVEIVDDDGNLLPDGSFGNIVVTSLTNLAMPLLRYEIGDRGALQRDAICPTCGWQGDLITRVMGRTVDVFVGQDGTRVDGEFFTHLFYFRPWVKQFQVVQETRRDIEVRIVLQHDADQIPDADRKEISAAIEKVLAGAQVHWNCVDEIEHDTSGKLRYTISRVSKH